MRNPAVRFFLPLALISFVSLLKAAPPSPEADQALRARVAEFYKLQIDRHFRQAEDYVAEDTKDRFYEMKKPDLKAAEITNIEYGPDGQSATVSLRVKATTFFIGAGPTVMDTLTQSTWKMEDGKWRWYISKDAIAFTPFGKSKSIGVDAPPDAGDPIAALHNSNGIGAAFRVGAVLPDRNEVHLDAAHPAPQIVNLKNILPGQIKLEAVNPPPGLKIEIAKPVLAQNESTTLTITPLERTSERPASVSIGVSPLKQVVPISIVWAN